MAPELQISRVEDCQEWLEKNAEKYETKQSIDNLISDLGTLVQAMAFVNGQMTITKRMWNKAKVKAYHTYLVSSKSQGFEMSPMLIKDYIAARCDTEQYNYDICERVSRTITHTVEVLRTCISALKMEVSMVNYLGQ